MICLQCVFACEWVCKYVLILRMCVMHVRVGKSTRIRLSTHSMSMCPYEAYQL